MPRCKAAPVSDRRLPPPNLFPQNSCISGFPCKPTLSHSLLICFLYPYLLPPPCAYLQFSPTPQLPGQRHEAPSGGSFHNHLSWTCQPGDFLCGCCLQAGLTLTAEPAAAKPRRKGCAIQPLHTLRMLKASLSSSQT